MRRLALLFYLFALTLVACGSKPSPCICREAAGGAPPVASPPASASKASPTIVPYEIPRVDDAIGAPLELPPGAPSAAPQRVLAITIAEDGAVFADGRAIADDDALKRSVTAALAADPSLRVIIHAAYATAHGRVLHTLDVVKAGGCTKIGFALDGRK